MIVGVVSDTHHGDKTRHIPSILFEKFEDEGVNLIIHAGDITSRELFERLKEIAPVVAVRGNADHLQLPEERIIDAEDLRIGVIHGDQFLGLNSQVLGYKALEMGVDVLIFGHTHRYFHDERIFHGRKIILLNPGSPTFPRMGSAGFALMRINGAEVRVKRIKLW
ncbi:YfcE family phosphodiesterase [Thermococcus sp.]